MYKRQIKTCANSGKGIKELENKISNKIIMLGGHSGVGKTSIINAIDGTLNLKVGNISDQHSQGKHTTTYAELYDLENNIKLIDTPGIKGFGLVNYNIDEISNFFPEFFNVKSKCKFNNCIHLNEPKCYVKEKVKSGEILLVSQFTLYADTKKGNRPSFIKAAKPENANKIYNSFIKELQTYINTRIKTGKFGAEMKINLINDGPVTIILEN